MFIDDDTQRRDQHDLENRSDRIQMGRYWSDPQDIIGGRNDKPHKIRQHDRQKQQQPVYVKTPTVIFYIEQDQFPLL